MDRGSGAHLESWRPTNHFHRRLPPELKGLVFSHLEGDDTSLSSCTLVCTSWAALTRPHLFRKVVCRPAVPMRTWDDFVVFLVTTPDVARFIRWLTVDGAPTSGSTQTSDILLEPMIDALGRIPALTNLYIRWTRFCSASSEPKLPSTPAPATIAPQAPRQRPISLKMLSICSCRVDTLVPLYHLLTSIAHIKTLALYGLSLEASSAQPLPAPLSTRIGVIQVDGYPLGGQFWTWLRRCLVSEASPGLPIPMSLSGGPMAVSTSLRCGPMAAATLKELLTVFGKDLHAVRINVLGASCHDLRYVVTGAPTRPPYLQPITTAFPLTSASEFPGFPRVDLNPYNSIKKLVLHFTTTSAMKTSRCATRFYGRLLENNWVLLSNAPTSLELIELRFQRYGPHTRSMLDDLRNIGNPAMDPEPPRLRMIDDETLARFPPNIRAMLETRHPPRPRWSMVDEGTLARFPALQAFTCVLCDGGFLDEYGPYVREDVDLGPKVPGSSRQQEFGDYVELLKSVLPRLHEKGILRFRMSEI
ncbi:hypothetical protein K466DRAFT_214729 [Polyporus arcularius HHB13444]|uniref:F-box domain-containing protein n=1 Tax=Polyporus arcularius HHB13444 TaxID=1314778 RepID=A0A5C3P749_9APHY|nr:hypothetical protein K466DRAFT_214729 [Polyporus arcularius HHB13444]